MSERYLCTKCGSWGSEQLCPCGYYRFDLLADKKEIERLRDDVERLEDEDRQWRKRNTELADGSDRLGGLVRGMRPVVAVARRVLSLRYSGRADTSDRAWDDLDLALKTLDRQEQEGDG